MLVLGYADWCGHCKNFMPTWNEFKAKHGNVIDIRELNADKDKQEIENLGIRGFPTLLMLNGKKKIKYEGERTLPALEAFVKTHLNPHVKDNLKNYRSM
tara:strand:+ start:953 stop:1249 length:297 start_codon:yes stop_codon:yes gene_type:complete